jgi:hypothetical protein
VVIRRTGGWPLNCRRHLHVVPATEGLRVFLGRAADCTRPPRRQEHVGTPLFHRTIDLGHVHCLRKGNLYDLLSRWRRDIVNIHIDDMVHSVHELMMFQGPMDLTANSAPLRKISYDNGVHVAPSRHNHAAVFTVRASMNLFRLRIGSTAAKYLLNAP